MSIITREMRDGVVVLLFDDPAASVNTLSHEALSELEGYFKKFAEKPDEGLKGVVIASAKSSFLAGADLREVQTMTLPEEAYKIVSWVSAIQNLIQTCAVPVVAAMNGQAMGGGFEIALACHARVATPDLRLGLPELELGLMPAAGGTQRLPRLIGLEPALEIILGGKTLSANEAKELGIIHEILPREKLIDGACELALQARPIQPWNKEGWTASPAPGSEATEALIAAAQQKLEKRMGDADLAGLEILKTIRAGYGEPLTQALEREMEGFSKLATSATAKNRIRTGFFGPQNLKAMKSRPAGIPPKKFKRIAVIGGGLMGGGIAYTAAQNGITVDVIEVDNAGVERTQKALARINERLVKRGKHSPEIAEANMARITVHEELPNLSDCDAVIEAVPEVAKIKADVLSRVSRNLPKDALIASNTSTMAISNLANHVSNPDRFIGMHFFSPVEMMPLLEIVSSKETSQAALANALDLAKIMRKMPITVNDGPGFYTSRIVGAYTGEALTLLAEGVPADLVDKAAREFGMPIGPLAMADTVSLPLLRDIYGALAAGGSAVVERGCRAQEALAALVEAGRQGRPQGGIFDYPEDTAPVPWSGLSGLFPTSNSAPDMQTIKKRLFHIQALEAVRAIEDGIISDKVQADVASSLGWAFPKSWGGVLSYVDTIGVTQFIREAEQLAAAHGERFVPPKMLHEMEAKGEKFHEM